MFINNYRAIVYRLVDDDMCYWVAETTEFPYVPGTGKTREEALHDLDEALELTITHMKENGDPIPEPAHYASDALIIHNNSPVFPKQRRAAYRYLYSSRNARRQNI